MKNGPDKKNSLKGVSLNRGQKKSNTGKGRLLNEVINDNEKKYKILFENAPVGISIIDSDWKIIEANSAFMKIARISKKDLLEDLYTKRKFIYSDGREMTPDELPTLTSLSKKIPVKNVVIGLVGNDNVVSWVQFSLAPLDKNRQFGVVIIQDITDRKNLEIKLTANEKKYRTFFENSLDAIMITSPDGSIYSANNAACKMLGWSEEDICRLGREGIVEQTPQLLESLRIRKETGKFIGELMFVKRNGIKFPVEISSSVFTDSDGRELTTVTAREITERKKAEEKIRNASHYARTLIEASLDPLITINYEGKITDVNSSTEKITGMKRVKLIGSDFSDYFTEPDKAREGYRIVFSKGVVKDYPLRILHTSGRAIDVLYNATLFKNEDGKVQGVFAAARDVTDHKKMEMELRNSKELLEKLNLHLQEIREDERSQIALNLHDDLGQRLTALYLDIAWLKSRIGVQSLAVRKKLEEVSQLINETIEGVKEFSSFLRPAILFDLGLVPAINEQLGKFKKQTGIICHFYCEPEEFIIDDRLALVLYRILQEALTNISRHAGASKTEITLRMLKNTIVMLIKDDGIGIDKDKINSLTSMGIAGIKERLKSVNGRVLIEGEKGVGTIMKVLIPFKKEENHD